MTVRGGAVTGATAQALIDVILQRPLAERPRRTGVLTRWQAFNMLWRQEWHGPEPEDRKVRWFAAVFTAVWHLVFSILMLWFWFTQSAYIEEATKRRGEVVVQVEFIGRGTPEEVGGGEAQEPAPELEPAPAEEVASETPAPSTDAAALPTPAVETPAVNAPLPDIVQREVPEPQVPPTPPVQQAVAVSAPTPDTSTFVLPPPTPRVVQPQIRVPEITAPAASMQAVEVPEPVQPIQREIVPRATSSPRIEARVSDVARREVSAPVERIERQVATPTVAQPTVRAAEATVRVREVPAPATRAATPAATAAQAPSSPTASSTAPSTAATSAPAKPAASGTTPAAAKPSGAAPSNATAGQGPKPIPAPGGFPTPVKADDWGASKRNVPGGQRGEPHGLYNSEGGPRLAEQPVNTGQPPGTVDDRIVDLDRSGTWLKRKPNDYEPTTFDKYWRPNETLLGEWVRKGIKRMAIPIPGTSKRIECVISLLQLGGGCGINDPNLNDQPASARPPPDIPFKPQLQEDNGSVKPKEGG
ncbi:DNA polymerase III subunit gamma/tau domain-containing protein [Lysobacter tyrosinilyticus]